MDDRLERAVEITPIGGYPDAWALLIDKNGTPFHITKNGVLWHDVDSDSVQTVIRLLLDKVDCW